MNEKRGFTKDFWLVVLGQIISLFGNAVVRFALPIHLLTMTGSATLLGIVSGCAFIPLAIMSPLGGIIADRVNKRNIMVFLDFFTALLTIVFLLLYGQVNTTGLILVTLFLLYGISGAYQPSVQASIPALVQATQIMPANAIINMVSSLAGLLGPALGGVAYSVWGIKPVLAIAGACFFLSAVMELFIHIPFLEKHRGESILKDTKNDIKESITFITNKTPAIGKLTICCAAVNMVLAALMIIGLPVIVTQVLSFTPSEASRLYGFMEACLAIGGLVGGMCAGIFCRKIDVNNSYRILTVSALLLLPMGLVLLLPCSAYLAYGVLAFMSMLIMALSSIYTIVIMSYIQMTVPQEIVGKVIAWVMAVSTCAHPVGQVLYGVLFEQLVSILWAIFFVAALLSFMIAWFAKRIDLKKTAY